MNIVIAQLSDIHFKEEKNRVAGKEAAIAQAIQSLSATARVCFIVVSGDVAFSGQVAEYNLAYAFFMRIRELLLSQLPSLNVYFVVVPGNHDCDFRKENRLRTLTLKSGDQILEQLDPDDDSIVRALVDVQDNFFTFLVRLENDSTHSITDGADVNANATARPIAEGYERLFYAREFEVDGKRFRFNCYNTAWVSQLHEQQAQLIFPIIEPGNDGGKYELVATTFHHPAQWLESNNARAFRGMIEPTSDIILTGHEHVAEHYLKQHTFSGGVNLYLEAPVLQESHSSESGFNLIEINLDGKLRRHTEFAWQKDIYAPVKSSEWVSFERSKLLRSTDFENNDRYKIELTDPGANIKHPSLAPLSLNDIFVYPELELLLLEKKAETSLPIPIVESERVLDYLLNNPRVVITSPTVNGKSTLARAVYTDLQKRGFVPLLIQGSDIKHHSADEFAKLIDKAFTEQYDADSLERYRQLDANRRVLLVDDFHRANRLNRKGKNAVLDVAGRIFGRIILLANDLFRFEELTLESDEQSVLFTFSQASMMPFGQRLRRQMISKWISFGREFTGDEEEIERKVDETANTITTLIGRKMVPSYPIFILSMLQVLEAKTNLNTAPSTFGYFYEVFILTGLSEHKTSSISMDVFTTYVPLIAYRMFELKRRSLSGTELEEVTNQYFSEYGINFNRETMLRILENSKILHQDATGAYRFNYKYGYYYFVAKYIAINLNTSGQQQKMRRHITRMANNLFVEDYANIVIFLVYLTKDEKTISQILMTAKSLYSEYEPCDLQEDVSFINQMELEPPPPNLLEGDPAKNKEEYLRGVDEIERRFDGDDLEEDDDLKLERELNDILRLNVALKTLQIMGQVLRNFPGALRREQKIKLLSESYNLGFRTMKMMFSIMDELGPHIREHLADFVRGQNDAIEDEALSKKVDQVLFLLVTIIAYGMVKRISQAVGSEHLRETYKELVTDDCSVATRMVDTSIKIDHFRPFPEKEVLDLYRKVENNKLTLTVLRQMVRDHFHLSKEDRKLRQRVCDKIGISFQEQRMIENKGKL
jgi:hypothetical protein